MQRQRDELVPVAEVMGIIYLTPWRQVYNPQNFRRRILRELIKVKLAWPKLNYSTAKGLLILHPSTPAIAPLNQNQLAS